MIDTKETLAIKLNIKLNVSQPHCQTDMSHWHHCFMEIQFEMKLFDWLHAKKMFCFTQMEN